LYDEPIKIIVFGDESVEKTHFIIRYISGFFLDDLKLTIGVDFYSKTINFDDKKFKLQIWDFAGEERFRFLLPSYVKGASGGIFMYDITNYGSLSHINEWFDILDKEKDLNKNFPVIVVGGKADLEHYQEVSTIKAMQIAKSKNAKGFIECSSKTGENVNKIFDLLTRLIMKNIREAEQE
jgi:small GTP-binding protein